MCQELQFLTHVKKDKTKTLIFSPVGVSLQRDFHGTVIIHNSDVAGIAIPATLKKKIK